MLQKTAYIYRSKCVECESCVSICPQNAILIEPPYGIVVETDLCSGCGKCIVCCPQDALKLI